MVSDSGQITVTLKAYNEIGCVDEISRDYVIKEPDILEVPDAFTPNNDLVNNQLQPITTPSITSWEMKVYDRWGGKVFQGINKPWDGNYINGVPAMQGVYVVTIDYGSICSEDESKRSNPARFNAPGGSEIKKAVILIR